MSTDVAFVRQTRAYPVAEWAKWHADREADLAQPHGWLSLVGFHWLSPEPTVLQEVPGLWSAQGDHAEVSATAADALVVMSDDRVLEGSLRASVPEQGSLSFVKDADPESNRVFELIRRDGRYAIRIRDPKASARLQFEGVRGYPLDARWVLAAIVRPRRQADQVIVNTARPEVHETIQIAADVTLTLPDDTEVTMAASAGPDGSYSFLFHDSTNGLDTARWRVVWTGVPNGEGRTEVDFNRALNMPFAFSDHGTCPAPPAGNLIPTRVTAGELAPGRS